MFRKKAGYRSSRGRKARRRGTVLNTNMLLKRKYEIVDGVERFKKWKGRLAVVGTGEIPGIGSSFSSFSQTVAFRAVH